MKFKVKGLGLVLAGVCSMQVSAATDSYFLNLSNDLPDGVNYAKVSISDSTTTVGDIDFMVEVISSAFSVSGTNFGMQTFSFNYDTNLTVSNTNIVNLDPSSWGISQDVNAGGGFGKFEFQLAGTGSSRTTLLEFSLTGVSGDSLSSYAIGSTLSPSSGEFFAAHIAGFDTTNGVTSAQFAGSTEVPIPAAAWLFGSALIGLAGIARKRKTS